MTLALALLLDALMGEPQLLWRRIPHPVVLFGRTISWADARFNQGTYRQIKGTAALALGLATMILLGKLIQALPTALPDLLIAAVLIAHRSLVDHVSDVGRALGQSLPQAQLAVAKIVGRDTSAMDAPAITRAAIESGAENLSDGVIAPAFWFAIAGVPGILCYKLVNTADSMIGYRTPKHKAFGWAAARLDDVMNLIPARLTALLLWLPKRQGRWAEIARDARKHRSPNAGWPEAALARALGIALAGPRSYHGRTENLPWVHSSGRKTAAAPDIRAATTALWQAWALTVFAALLLALL